MSIKAFSTGYVTVEEYLASEELSETKHEYLGGVVHAMAGASEPHSMIRVSLTGMLYNRLRGKRCQPFGPDMQVLLHPQPSGRAYYYYPDAMIACDPTDIGHGWRERPAVLFESLRRAPVRSASARNASPISNSPAWKLMYGSSRIAPK